MRSVPRTLVLLPVILSLLVPLTAFASDGPCPDDLELAKNCSQEAPPYYVVINRSVELNYPQRPGTGCQPIILNHPECTDCVAEHDCTPIAHGLDVEAEVCFSLPKPPPGETHIVYEMCCACASDPAGQWKYRIRELDSDGFCPIVSPEEGWYDGLPPDTGIDLPPQLVVGGLAVAGVALLGLAMVVRRRTTRIA